MGNNGDSGGTRGSSAGRRDNGKIGRTLDSAEMEIIPEFQDGQAGRDNSEASGPCSSTGLCPDTSGIFTGRRLQPSLGLFSTQGRSSAPVQGEFLGSIPAHSSGAAAGPHRAEPGWDPIIPAMPGPPLSMSPGAICCAKSNKNLLWRSNLCYLLREVWESLFLLKSQRFQQSFWNSLTRQLLDRWFSGFAAEIKPQAQQLVIRDKQTVEIKISSIIPHWARGDVGIKTSQPFPGASGSMFSGILWRCCSPWPGSLDHH